MTRTRYKILPGDINPYLITATTVDWLPLFSNPEIAGIIFESLKFLQTQSRLMIYAYVLMENHFHMVASADQLDKQVANFKSFTARKCLDYYLAVQSGFILEKLELIPDSNRHDRQYHFWQEGVGPKRISDREMMEQKVNYIHFNPVRRGYVELPEHWRYSSARNYAGMEGLLDVNMEW